MKAKKEVKVANFNLVLGDEEKPMLDYFDLFIYPAFISGITRKERDSEFLFMEVSILNNSLGDYVLTGKFVKKTMLEVRSDIDNYGNLVEKDEKYSAAPYSTFAIFLRNHRMIMVPNQKGSPSLSSFRTTAFSILSKYRRITN